MITIRSTITNSTPGLKAASCGEHPWRWRVHRGEPIKCFKKFDRKTTTTQEVKFVYGKQFEKPSNPHTISNTLANAAITRAKSVWINERTQPKRNGSPADDWLTSGDDNTLRSREFSWTRPTPLPPPPQYHTSADRALSSPRGARYTEIETMFRFIVESDSDTWDSEIWIMLFSQINWSFWVDYWFFRGLIWPGSLYALTRNK